jgi:hypothetical protein
MPDSLQMSPVAACPVVEGRPHIMLAVHQGFSIRYLLQTDIFSALQNADCDVTVLTQDDPAYLKSRFGAGGVRFESIPWSVGEAYAARSRIERVLDFIRHYAHRGNVKVSEHHYWIAARDGQLFQRGLLWRLRHSIVRAAILATRRSFVLRRLVLWGLGRYVPEGHIDKLSRLAPDLIVTTSLGTFDYDQYIMRAASRLNIPVISVILSWDNTTCRGYPGARPWHVIAWTEEMRRELIEHNDIPAERISVCGIAHFDRYFHDDPDFDRDSFLAEIGLDPGKKTVVVATKSPNTYAYNPNLAAILGQAVQDGRLPPDTQILLRVHPLFYRYRNSRFLFQDALEACRRVATMYPAVHLNEPTIQSNKVNYDMRTAETKFVARLLRSTDVLVNIYSTMNIEGAIFDVPLVNARIEDKEMLYEAHVDARFDIRIDHDSDHNLRIVNSGGTRVASTPEELVAAVAAYLADRTLDQRGRQRIVEQEVGPNRGNAGRAIGTRIFELARQAARRR